MRKLLLTLLLCFSSANALSLTHVTGKVTGIDISQGQTYVQFTTDNMPSGVTWFRIHRSWDNYQYMFALLTVSGAASEDIQIWYNDNSISSEEDVVRMIKWKPGFP